MKSRFYLRKETKKNVVYFEFRNGKNVRFRSSTNFLINSLNDWDEKKQRVKLPSRTINATLINTKLSEFQNLLDDLLYKSRIDEVGVNSVKEIFSNVFQTLRKKEVEGKNSIFCEEEDKTDDDNDLISYIDWFLDFYSKNNSPYSKKRLTKGTLRTLKNTQSILKKYVAHKRLKTLYFDDINRKFYNDIVSYLNEQNYTTNYLGTIIQKIKTFMTYALDEGRHSNLEFKKSYFSKITEVVNHPYLSLEELQSIEDLVLNDKEMDLSRDIFLVGCFSGLRIGDLLKFIKNPTYAIHDNKKIMQLKQNKTSKQVFIPINSKIQRIMDKYNGNMPDYLHQNIINKHLKSICKRANIIEEYQYTRTEGGVEVTHKKPKYKFISTHCARRSFCSNAYKEGIPVHDIMAISGHRTERVFLDYIKVDLLQNASRIAEHSFFK